MPSEYVSENPERFALEICDANASENEFPIKENWALKLKTELPPEKLSDFN